MKPIPFTKCLDRALALLRNRKGILYVSVGSFLKNNASMEKTHTQQAPLSILHSGKPAVIILADPLFAQGDPLYIQRLKEYHVRENGTEVLHSKVVFLQCAEFLEDGSYGLQKLARLTQQNPYVEFYIGDYTLTQPYQPFHEYPLLKKSVASLPNVWLSRSCVREDFVHA